MTEKAASYRVGRGKPPEHTRFKKGQSGNPSGRPGPAKKVKAKLRGTLLAALDVSRTRLSLAEPTTTLESIAKEIALSAARGKSDAVKLLLSLLEEGESAKPTKRTATSSTDDESGTSSLPQGETQGGIQKKRSTHGRPTDAQIEDETGTSSLPQGKTQGRFASETPAPEKTVAEQSVEETAAAAAGKEDETAGNAATVPARSEVPPRPKRMTIWVAGQLVQQGD
jgi:hypothetical protein